MALVAATIQQRAEAKKIRIACPDKVIDRQNGFYTIAAPEYPAHPGADGDDLASQGRDYDYITHYVVDPSDSDRIFVSNKYWIQRSEDGGCTWEPVFSVPVPAFTLHTVTKEIYSIDMTTATSGSGRLLVQVADDANSGSHHSAIYASEDLGDSWSLNQDIGSPDGATTRIYSGDLTVSPSDPERVYLARYAGANTRYFASRDGGDSWTLLNTPEGMAANDTELAVNPDDPDDLWQSFGGPNAAQRSFAFYHSTDGGASWSKVNVPFDPRYTLDIDVHSSNATAPERIAITGFDDQVFYSTDAGRSWGQVQVPDPIGDYIGVEFGKGGNFLFIMDRVRIMGRFDLKRKTTTQVRSGDSHWDQDPHQSGWTSSDIYVPSAGLFFAAECSLFEECKMIGRFIGRGT